jgi:ATP-binding cassette, subfamily C, bacterial CydC
VNSRLKIQRTLFAQARAYPLRIAVAFLLGSGTIIAGLGLLASSGYLISAAALRPPILDLMVVIVAVRFFGISRAVLRYSERMLSHDITFRLLLQMRSRFFKAIDAASASRLLGYRSGSMLSTLTSDIDELQNYYIRVLTPTAVAILVSLTAFFFVKSYSPVAAWATLSLLTLNGIALPLGIRRLSRGLGIEQVRLRSELSHHWVEHVQGLSDIRLHDLQKTYLERSNDLSERISDIEQRQGAVTGLQDAMQNWILYGAAVVSLLLTAPLVLNGDLAGVMLALVVFSVMASFEATQNLGLAFQYLESSEQAVNNLQDIMSHNLVGSNQVINTLDNSCTAKIKLCYTGTVPGGLSFDAVSFSYRVNRILENVGFTVSTGEKVALVGPSGSGKSTIANLFLKFHEPEQGNIFLGGRKLSGMSAAESRSLISIVDQSTYLFHDTLRYNLTLSCEDADDEKLLEVINSAHLWTWFQGLEKGLDTILGEHGKQLSGGERQRLSIARSLLRNPGIWILDEPTANLDTLTEKAIIKTLREVTKNCTVLWITHRFVKMDYYDRIYVLESGRLSDRGKHYQLMKKRGWYSEMVRLQADMIEDMAT